MGASGDAPELHASAQVERRAEAIAASYTVLVEPSPVESGKGWYTARALEVPTAFANGKSPAEAFDKLQAALVTMACAMLSEGITPPLPASAGRREHQMNIRLSALERAKLEAAARLAGYRSVSDFVRAAAISKAS